MELNENRSKNNMLYQANLVPGFFLISAIKRINGYPAHDGSLSSAHKEFSLVIENPVAVFSFLLDNYAG